MSPFLLAPGGEFGALPPELSGEGRFPTSPISFPEFLRPPSLIAVTGGPAGRLGCMGPEEGSFNGPEEGSSLTGEAGWLLFSGLSGDLEFPGSVKSGRFSPPLRRGWVTGGSLGGGSGEGVSGSWAIGLLGGSGEGVSGSLAIGLLGVTGGIKSSLGGGEGSTGVGGGVSVGSSSLISGGGVAATGGSSGIGGGVGATGGSSGIGGGSVATGGSSGIGGGVAATGCSSGGVGSGGGSGFNVSGGGDTFS
jgi:hypothetical protein